MKIKFLTVLGLAAVVGLGGCKSAANSNAASPTGTATNTAVATNVNMSATMTPTPVAKTNESAATDPNLKSKIENALKAKGFTDVTVDTSTTPATLRGSYPKAKIAEVMQTAQEAAGKPVQNQATGK